MFESTVPVDEDWFDAAWIGEAPAGDQIGQIPAAQCAPSGWLGLELDHATVEPGRLTDADLIDAITGFERMSSWAGARQAALLAEFARRRPDDHSLAGDHGADEIALALRLSRTAAAERLARAEVLTADLPATAEAWEAGLIDGLKTRAIVEAAYRLPGRQRAALEKRVLPRASEQPIARLRAALRRAVLALDPQGGQDRFEQRRSARRVVVSPDEGGMATLWALLAAPDATAAYQHLGDLARGLGADDPRNMDARRADLLVDLLTGRDIPTADLAADGRSAHRSARPGKPLVSVVVPVTTLMGLDDQPGELVGHGPIPADLAREIAAEGTWRRLLTDPVSGALLDHGRSTYRPPAGLADFVRTRDLYCRHPGCGQRAATADLDHTVPYPQGTTSEHNIGAYCRHHHLVKTFASGWRVEQFPDGRITWTTPTGHTYTSHPYDYRPCTGPDPPGHDPPSYDEPPPFRLGCGELPVAPGTVC